MTKDGSTTVGETRNNGMPAAYEGSGTIGLLRVAMSRIAHVVCESKLYQWVTTEPDPEVIVIDLRETWTVGPILTLLDRVVGAAINAAGGSVVVAHTESATERLRASPLRFAGLLTHVTGAFVLLTALASEPTLAMLVIGAALLFAGALATREDRSWDELRETRVFELLIQMFEPPSPPERDSD